MKLILAAVIFTLGIITSFGGDVYDLGKSRTVPDWAVGPLLVVSVDQFHAQRANFTREKTIRIGTIQSNYLELSGHRIRLATIELSEIPNDSKGCYITTVPEGGSYFEIRLSQRLFDQTYYFVLIEKMDVATAKKAEKQPFPEQLTVWDIKSRK
ncbi:MAG: hypothetical protein NTY98_17670 [Verrucomicrobia bacterium]|nr:hypothetical protein [Verrucomicrobiota bacterium]